MVELDSKARSTLRFPPVVGKAKELNNGDVAGKVKDVALFPVYQWFSVPLHSRPIRVRIFISCIFLAFLAFALFTYPMTGVHPALKPTFLMRPNEAVSFPAVDFTNRRQLNETLLAFAQIDLGEAEERRQITNILDGTWAGSSMTRYTSLRDRFGDRFGTDPYDHFEDRRGRPSRLRERLPIQLTSPRYSPFWPQFRRSLQRWVQVKRYEPQIMRHLLQLVKDPVDRHYRSKGGLNVDPGKPYKTCAVVGNSGILLNQSYASRIDSHDMVMRLNNAKTAGFENRVGSKTTLAFVNSNILHSCSRRSRCFCHPYGDEVPMIMYICQVVHFMDMALCAPSHKAPIIVTDPRFDALCARIVKYYSLRNFVESTGRRPEDWSDSHDGPMFHYSSGMQAIVLALGICEKVTIFGFGKSSSARHHYHTNQKAELHLHDYAAEYQFYHDLVHQRSTVIPFLNDAGFVIPPVEVYW